MWAHRGRGEVAVSPAAQRPPFVVYFSIVWAQTRTTTEGHHVGCKRASFRLSLSHTHIRFGAAGRVPVSPHPPQEARSCNYGRSCAVGLLVVFYHHPGTQCARHTFKCERERASGRNGRGAFVANKTRTIGNRQNTHVHAQLHSHVSSRGEITNVGIDAQIAVLEPVVKLLRLAISVSLSHAHTRLLFSRNHEVGCESRAL